MQQLHQLIWKAISLAVLAAWAAPFVGLLVTRDAAYLWLAAGVMALEASARALHAIPVSLSPLLKRPSGARDCSGFNGGGACGGKNGMPSGHVAIVAFAAFGTLAIEGASSWSWLKATGAAVLVLAVAASRVALRCHTVLQTVAGAALGGLLALLLMFIRRQSKKNHDVQLPLCK